MTTTIKTNFASDLRRFAFPTTGTFQELQNVLSTLYGPLSKKQVFNLQYRDDEGDFITVTNDIELLESFKFGLSGQPLRFTVSVVNKKKSLPVDLFNSWVMLLTEAKEQLTSQKETQEKNVTEIEQAIKEFHDIEEKIVLSKKMLPDIEEPAAIVVPIRDLVQVLSKEIAESMVELSSRIARLVTVDESSEEDTTHIKKVILQAENLAKESQKICNSLSDEAIQQVKTISSSTLQQVALDSNSIRSLLEIFYKSSEQPDLLLALSNDTLTECNSLSASTTEQCLSDAESIAEIIRSL